MAPLIFAQDSVQKMAVEFERSLGCDHRRWNDQETSSFLEAAVFFAPSLASNPRIAGTHGRIGDNKLGYHGAVVFGPLRVSDRQIDYYAMSIWGDVDKGWRFLHHHTYSARSSNRHPIWLLLADDNLRDDFQISEELALDIVSRVRSMSEQKVRSADGELLVPLTANEIDRLHGFEVEFWTPSDFIRKDVEPPWWEGHRVITAKSQQPGSHRYEYQSAVQFAMTSQGPKFIRVFPAHGSRRKPTSKCRE
jgi:hypothetical protein